MTTNNGQPIAYVHAELCNVPAHAELEQALAHERGLREAADLACEQVRALSKLEIKRLVTEREAAEALGPAFDALNEHALALTAYATRLLAALTQQRQALTDISDLWVKSGTRAQLDDAMHIADTALAADHAALVSEAESLGVEVTDGLGTKA